MACSETAPEGLDPVRYSLIVYRSREEKVKDLFQAKVVLNEGRNNDGHRLVVPVTAVVMATNVANVLSLFVRCGCPVSQHSNRYYHLFINNLSIFYIQYFGKGLVCILSIE